MFVQGLAGAAGLADPEHHYEIDVRQKLEQPASGDLFVPDDADLLATLATLEDQLHQVVEDVAGKQIPIDLMPSLLSPLAWPAGHDMQADRIASPVFSNFVDAIQANGRRGGEDGVVDEIDVDVV